MTQKVIWIINQYANTPTTGAGGRHYYFARELAKRGYKVYLIMASFTHWLRTPPLVSSSFQIEQENGIHIVWVRMPIYNGAQDKKRIRNWFIFAVKLRDLLRKIPDRPNVILYSSLSLVGFLGASYLAKKLGVRLVFEVRDIWPLSLVELGGYSIKHPFVRVLQWIEDRAYKESDAIISNLKYAVEHIVDRGGDRDKFVWIPNGFSLDEVSESEVVSPDVLALIPKDKFLVGYTGAVGTANALDTLIGAAIVLADSHPRIVFVIVGEGQYKNELQKRVLSHELQNVIFIDPIPKKQIQNILYLFDALYIGLKNTPLFHFGVSPNKLFDYLYASKPIVYAIDSGKYNPVNEYRAGIQVEPENIEQIKEAILKLYDMPESMRNTLGSNGREAALKYYEYGKLTDKIEDILFP